MQADTFDFTQELLPRIALWKICLRNEVAPLFADLHSYNDEPG